jgi:hypothetical protein
VSMSCARSSRTRRADEAGAHAGQHDAAPPRWSGVANDPTVDRCLGRAVCRRVGRRHERCDGGDCGDPPTQSVGTGGCSAITAIAVSTVFSTPPRLVAKISRACGAGPPPVGLGCWWACWISGAPVGARRSRPVGLFHSALDRVSLSPNEGGSSSCRPGPLRSGLRRWREFIVHIFGLGTN